MTRWPHKLFWISTTVSWREKLAGIVAAAVQNLDTIAIHQVLMNSVAYR
jgi:hypothetical protein